MSRSNCLRIPRTIGSTFRPSTINGSVDALTAASPPFTRSRRTAGSVRRDLPISVCRDGRAERTLFLRFLRHQLRVEQAVVFAGERFERVFEPEDEARGLARLLRSAGAVLPERVDAPLDHVDRHRIDHIAFGL